MNKYCTEIAKIIKSVKYILPVSLVAILSFGFTISHMHELFVYMVVSFPACLAQLIWPERGSIFETDKAVVVNLGNN